MYENIFHNWAIPYGYMQGHKTQNHFILGYIVPSDLLSLQGSYCTHSLSQYHYQRTLMSASVLISLMSVSVLIQGVSKKCIHDSRNNISGYKHVKSLGHISLERRDPWLRLKCS